MLISPPLITISIPTPQKLVCVSTIRGKWRIENFGAEVLQSQAAGFYAAGLKKLFSRYQKRLVITWYSDYVWWYHETVIMYINKINIYKYLKLLIVLIFPTFLILLSIGPYFWTAPPILKICKNLQNLRTENNDVISNTLYKAN